MDIKLIALDMDGTTLDSRINLAEATRHAIEAALNKGCTVVPCSGRVFGELPRTVMTIDGLQYAVTSNGAKVWTLNPRDTLYENPIQSQMMRELLNILEQYDLMVEAYMNGGVKVEARCLIEMAQYHVPSVYHEMFRETRETLPTHDCFYDYLVTYPVEKLNVFFRHTNERERLRDQLEAQTDLKIIMAAENNLEINNPTANKGDGLRHLCEHLGIADQEVMAIGDSNNDMEMLKYAGLSVAMDNANANVKKAADYVTADNDHLGVVQALDQFVL